MNNPKPCDGCDMFSSCLEKDMPSNDRRLRTCGLLSEWIGKQQGYQEGLAESKVSQGILPKNKASTVCDERGGKSPDCPQAESRVKAREREIMEWVQSEDVCACGDYRRQHKNGTGRCHMPDDGCHGFEPCKKFVLCGLNAVDSQRLESFLNPNSGKE